MTSIPKVFQDPLPKQFAHLTGIETSFHNICAKTQSLLRELPIQKLTQEHFVKIQKSLTSLQQVYTCIKKTRIAYQKVSKDDESYCKHKKTIVKVHDFCIDALPTLHSWEDAISTLITQFTHLLPKEPCPDFFSSSFITPYEDALLDGLDSYKESFSLEELSSLGSKDGVFSLPDSDDEFIEIVELLPVPITLEITHLGSFFHAALTHLKNPEETLSQIPEMYCAFKSKTPYDLFIVLLKHIDKKGLPEGTLVNDIETNLTTIKIALLNLIAEDIITCLSTRNLELSEKNKPSFNDGMNAIFGENHAYSLSEARRALKDLPEDISMIKGISHIDLLKSLLLIRHSIPI